MLMFILLLPRPSPVLSAELPPLWPKTCSPRPRAGGEGAGQTQHSQPTASVGRRQGGLLYWRPRQASVLGSQDHFEQFDVVPN